jgi:hypothetical protein
MNGNPGPAISNSRLRVSNRYLHPRTRVEYRVKQPANEHVCRHVGVVYGEQDSIAVDGQIQRTCV